MKVCRIESLSKTEAASWDSDKKCSASGVSELKLHCSIDDGRQRATIWYSGLEYSHFIPETFKINPHLLIYSAFYIIQIINLSSRQGTSSLQKIRHPSFSAIFFTPRCICICRDWKINGCQDLIFSSTSLTFPSWHSRRRHQKMQFECFNVNQHPWK